MTFSFPVWLWTTALMPLDSFRALELMEKKAECVLSCESSCIVDTATD